MTQNHFQLRWTRLAFFVVLILLTFFISTHIGPNDGLAGLDRSVYALEVAYATDVTAPTQDSLTTSSLSWEANGFNTYDITLIATDTDSGILEMRALINHQGANKANKRGYFAWKESGYTWGAANSTDRMACDGGGYAEKYNGTAGTPIGYGRDYSTLAGCSTQFKGGQRTVTFTVQPHTNFGNFDNNDISFWARDYALNKTGWINYDLNFKSAGVDVMVEDLVSGVPGKVARGDTLKVTWTVKNNSEIDLNSALETAIYLSQSDGSGGIMQPPPENMVQLPNLATGNPGSIEFYEAPGGLLLYEGTINPLLAGSSETYSIDLLIPSTVADGTWYLLFVADSTMVILESDESNNVAAKELMVNGGSPAISGGSIVHIGFEPGEDYFSQGVELINILPDPSDGIEVCNNGSPFVGAAFDPPGILNVPNGFTSIQMQYAHSELTVAGFNVWSEANASGTLLETFYFVGHPNNGSSQGACFYDVWFSTGFLSIEGKSIEFFENDSSPNASWHVFDDIFLTVQQSEIEVHDDPIEPREGEEDGFTFGITLADEIPYGLDVVDADNPILTPRSVEITLERVSGDTGGEDLTILGADTLTFDSTNWNIQQTFTIQAPENDDDNTNQNISYRLFKSGGTSPLLVAEQTLSVTEIDDDFTFDVETTTGGGIIVQPGVNHSFLDINDYDWSTIEMTAVPNSGYQFAEWTTAITADAPGQEPIIPDGDIVLPNNGLNNPTTINQLVLNTDGSTGFVVSAFFEEIPTANVTVFHNGSGATTVNGQIVGNGQSINIPQNEDIPITASPSVGWMFSGWTSSPTNIIADPSAASTTVNTSNNATITANFSPIPVTLTILNDGNGTTSPTTATVNPGSIVLVTVIPNSGFKFKDWTIIGGDVQIDTDEASPNLFIMTVFTNATIRANFEPLSPGTLLIRAINQNDTSDVIELRQPQNGIVQELTFLKEQGGSAHQYELQFFREGDLPLIIESTTLQEGVDFCLRTTSQLDPPPGDCPLQQPVSPVPLPTVAEGNPPKLYLDFGSGPNFPDQPNPNDDELYTDSFSVLIDNPPFELVFDMRGTVLGSTDVANITVEYLLDEDPPFPPTPIPINNGGDLTLDTVDAGINQTLDFQICNSDTENPFFADKLIDNQNDAGLDTDQYGFFFVSGDPITVPPADNSGPGCLNFALILKTNAGVDALYEAIVGLGTNDNLFVFQISVQADASTIVTVTAEILFPGGAIGFQEIPNDSDYTLQPDAPVEGQIYKFRVHNPNQSALIEVSNLGVSNVPLSQQAFSLEQDQSTLPGIIGPNSDQVFSIRLSAPEEFLPYTGEVSFQYRRLPDGPWKTFEFLIRGTVGDAQIEFDIDPIDFPIPDPPPGVANADDLQLPSVFPGEENVFALNIRHTGTAGDPALNVNVNPDVGTGFSVSPTSFSIQPGNIASVQVLFSAATPGTYPGTIIITSNDPVVPAFMLNVVAIVTGIPAPTNLAGVAVDATRVELEWDPVQAGDLQGYHVYRAVGNGPMTLIASTSTALTNYSDTTVAPATTYKYEVTAFNATDESNPSNRITITTPALADLQILNPGWYIAIYPSYYGFYGDLTNSGGGSTFSYSTVKWYYSTDQTLSGGDILLYSSTEPILGPGGSSVANGFVDFADYDFGPGYILMVADANDDIVESDENNNVTVIPNFTIPSFDGADLIVTNGAGFMYVEPGSTINLWADVKNIGDDPTTGSSNLGIYIADNSIFDPPPTPGETTLLKQVTVGVLDAGELTRLDPIQVTIPGDTPEGEYELGYQADYNDDITEADENNNLLRLVIHVQNLPLPPANVNATDTFEDRIEVTWDAVEGADQYLVWRNTENNPNTAVLAETSLDTIHYFYTGSFANARPDTVYYFWVQTVNQVGTSDYSAVETGYIPDNSVPLMWIDEPGHDSTQSGIIEVKGWALDATLLDASNIAFTMDGNPITLQDFEYGTGRGDVCNNHEDVNSPNCPFVGWRGYLDTTGFSNDQHVLWIIVTDSSENQDDLPRTFHISN